MPAKAKKTVVKDEKIELEKSSKRAKTSTKKVASSANTKKASSKTAAKKADSSKTKTASKKTATTTKKATTSTTKKRTTTKKTTASTTRKRTTTKKTATSATKKRTTAKKTATSTTRKKAATKKEVAVPSIEYYDLPYRYNETIVKVLAQTPKSLFVYWDISDHDRENFVKTFGENFFNDTIPFLRITNENNGYSFDIDIDDFANGWYVPIGDAKCTYSVSLLRKQRPFRNKIVEHEIYVTTSNKIEAPNDHILFEKATPTVLYKNVKTNSITSKTLPTTIYRKSRREIYGLYEHYKEIYNSEDIEEMFDLNNPSSGNPTSTFK